jgi:NADH-quinone oxidoreductase subunit C
MTPAELAQHLTEATGAVASHEVMFGQLGVHVEPSKWLEVATHLKDCGSCRFDFITFLTAVDEEDKGFEVVLRVLSVRRSHAIVLKTIVPKDNPTLPTLRELWSGADWCERETWELFGIRFEGHPNLVKLLLPDEFEGFPLRKDFPMATREAKEWPGMKEPAEAGH